MPFDFSLSLKLTRISSFVIKRVWSAVRSNVCSIVMRETKLRLISFGTFNTALLTK